MAAVDDLLLRLQQWTNRREISADVMTDWVRAASTRLNLELRVREMITKLDLTFSVDGFDLPADYQDRNTLRYVANPNSDLPSVKRGRSLDYVPESEYWERKSDAYSTTGPVYTVEGYRIYASHAAVGTILSLSYYKKIPDISLGSNWLWAEYPHVYIFAAMAEAEAYLEGDERFTLWTAKATALIESMNNTAQANQHGRGMLKKRFRSFG